MPRAILSSVVVRVADTSHRLWHLRECQQIPEVLARVLCIRAPLSKKWWSEKRPYL